jgi:hypothetical protein
MLTIVANRCDRRDTRLAAEAQRAIAYATDNDHKESEVNVRLRIQLELQTILCTEYRYVQSSTTVLVLGSDIYPPAKEMHTSPS